MGGSPIFFFPNGCAEHAPLRPGRRAKLPAESTAWCMGERQVQAVQDVVETALAGLGYEVVDVEWSGGGLLRVYIDAPDGIKLDDCERASHQLSHALTVENVHYERLEVSSPGLDRPLKKLADFARFTGHKAWIKFRAPLKGRKQFEGILQPVVAADDPGVRIGLVIEDKDANEQLLEFTLAEVDKAHLVPHIDFRSKKR
jgi:ribosome maturation factor RimP